METTEYDKLEQNFQMLWTVQYVGCKDKWTHQSPLSPQKHDSGDRVPTVLWAAACLPGAEAMVGCVYRLPVRGHADDWCVRMHFAGRSRKRQSKTLSHRNLLKTYVIFNHVYIRCSFSVCVWVFIIMAGSLKPNFLNFPNKVNRVFVRFSWVQTAVEYSQYLMSWISKGVLYLPKLALQ